MIDKIEQEPRTGKREPIVEGPGTIRLVLTPEQRAIEKKREAERIAAKKKKGKSINLFGLLPFDIPLVGDPLEVTAGSLDIPGPGEIIDAIWDGFNYVFYNAVKFTYERTVSKAKEQFVKSSLKTKIILSAILIVLFYYFIYQKISMINYFSKNPELFLFF